MVMVPADGNFTTAIARGNHKAGEIQGQTRQHSRLINLLGVKQIFVGVNKMDTDVAGYKKRTLRRNQGRNGLYPHEGWMEKRLCRQIHSFHAHLWMDRG